MWLISENFYFCYWSLEKNHINMKGWGVDRALDLVWPDPSCPARAGCNRVTGLPWPREISVAGFVSRLSRAEPSVLWEDRADNDWSNPSVRFHPCQQSQNSPKRKSFLLIRLRRRFHSHIRGVFDGVSAPGHFHTSSSVSVDTQW